MGLQWEWQGIVTWYAKDSLLLFAFGTKSASDERPDPTHWQRELNAAPLESNYRGGTNQQRHGFAHEQLVLHLVKDALVKGESEVEEYKDKPLLDPSPRIF